MCVCVCVRVCVCVGQGLQQFSTPMAEGEENEVNRKQGLQIQLHRIVLTV